MAKNLEAELRSLEFKSLRLIIDHVIGNTSELEASLSKYVSLVAGDLDTYVDLLEEKIPQLLKFNYPEFQHWKQSEILGTDDPKLLELTRYSFENLERERANRDRVQRMWYEALFSEITDKIKQQQVAVVRIRKEVGLLKKPSEQIVERVPWKILPPGEHPFQQIFAYFKEVQRRHPELRIDEDRLKKVESLNPNQRFTGEDEFDGYVIFYFDRTETAVLESPLFGNAIYVIQGKWKSLSRKSKGELLTRYSGTVTRVIHLGDWFARLRKLVNQNPDSPPARAKVLTAKVAPPKSVLTEHVGIPNGSVINLVYTSKYAVKAQQARERLTSLGIAVHSFPIKEAIDVFEHRQRLYYFGDSPECLKTASRIAGAVGDIEEVAPQFRPYRDPKKDTESLYAIWLV